MVLVILVTQTIKINEEIIKVLVNRDCCHVLQNIPHCVPVDPVSHGTFWWEHEVEFIWAHSL